jgi:hypothetical protein
MKGIAILVTTVYLSSAARAAAAVLDSRNRDIQKLQQHQQQNQQPHRDHPHEHQQVRSGSITTISDQPAQSTDHDCSICWDMCIKPTNIDDISHPLHEDSKCGHMFCETCITGWKEAWAASRRPERHDHFQCPRCFKPKAPCIAHLPSLTHRAHRNRNALRGDEILNIRMLVWLENGEMILEDFDENDAVLGILFFILCIVLPGAALVKLVNI